MPQPKTEFYVGTAGWSYLQWEKEFYPKGTRSNEKLAYYATQFNAVELNNSFYRAPSAEQFARWAEAVPPDFRFAVKTPRLITHIKRLNGADKALAKFLAAAKLPKRQTGPIFFQLPPVMPLDTDRLRRFLAQLQPGQRCAMELRDPRWHVPEVYDALRERGVAFCQYDTPEGASPRVVTADFAYVRLRGRRSRKLTAFLAEWKDWLETHSAQAYVFFDNLEEKSLAFGNARRFRGMTERPLHQNAGEG